jgi:hypothetical protein
LSEISILAEKDFIANTNLDAVIKKERADSYKYGGKTVFGDARPPDASDNQLKLF